MTNEEKESRARLEAQKKGNDLFTLSIAVDHLAQDCDEIGFTKEDRDWIRNSIRRLLWLLEE